LIISLVALVVFFTGLLFTNPSYGMDYIGYEMPSEQTSQQPNPSSGKGNTGSIQLYVTYTSGDRTDNYGQVLKIYQDNNQTVYRIVNPDSYPVTIDSLPIGHKYKIDVYRYSMYGGSNYVDLQDKFEKVDVTIPMDSGLLFNVFYNDGQTPVSDAIISIKSYDGIEWEKGSTDDKGNSQRFWVQSTIRNGDYYMVTVLLGDSLTYSYSSQIDAAPNGQQNIKIVTPWSSIVDQLTVSAYKFPSQKVQTQDGNYLVILADNFGNQVATSNIDAHGQAHFSKLKVGSYKMHIIKTSPDSILGEEVALENVLLSGNQPGVDVLLQNLSNAVPVNLQNGTISYPNGTALLTTTMTNQESCHCVIFRIDDVQDHFVRASDMAVLNLFILKHKELTLGIVTNYTGKDHAMVETIKQGIRKGVFYPVVHGYDHIDYTTLGPFEQWNSLRLANAKMMKLLGNTSDILIPPYNHFNNVTLGALHELGFKILSAGSLPDHEVYHFSTKAQSFNSSKIYHLPQLAEFPHSRAVELNYFSTVSKEDIMRDLFRNLKTVGYGVITLHPQDFAQRDKNQHFFNTNNSVNRTEIEQLSELLDNLDAQNIKITNYYDVTGLPPRKFLSNENASVTQDASVVNLFTLGRSPTAVAVNPDTNVVYVTNSNSDSVSVIDGKTDAVLGTVGVGNIPVGISVNTKTNMVYVINSHPGTVSVINGTTNTVSDTLDLRTITYGVSVNPVLNMVYIIDPYTPAVNFVDGNTNKIMDTVKVEGSPQRIAVNPVTNMIYVTDSKSNSVSVIDGTAKAVVGTIQLGNDTTPLAIAVNPGTNTVYVTNSKSDSVSVIDGSTNNVVRTIQLGNDDTPLAIAANPGTNTVYVTNSKSDSVSVIDGSTNNVVRTVQLDNGSSPSGIDFNGITNSVYVSNIKSGTLALIDANQTSSESSVPEFNLMAVMIFSISVSILIFVTRLKMVNVGK